MLSKMVVPKHLYDEIRPDLPHFKGPTIKQSTLFLNICCTVAFLASHDQSKKNDFKFFYRMVVLKHLYDEIRPHSSQFFSFSPKCKKKPESPLQTHLSSNVRDLRPSNSESAQNFIVLSLY